MNFRLKELELLIFKRKKKGKAILSRFPDHYIVLEKIKSKTVVSLVLSTYVFFLSLGQLACPPGQVEQLYG